MSDNELIAIFMDCKLHRSIWGGSGSHAVTYIVNGEILYPSEMKYNTSWDWLMPVVHKILKTTEPPSGQGWSYEYKQLEAARLGNTIEYVYQRVVAFIKLYNTQTTKP